MTNEELIARLYDGENVTEELYLNNKGLIVNIAKSVAGSYGLSTYYAKSKEAVFYSEYVINELISEGSFEFFRLLSDRKYDSSCGKFTTFIYPYIKSIMLKWCKTNIRRECLYGLSLVSENGDVENPSLRGIISPEQLEYGSVDYTVYLKIRIELLHELFDELPEKQKAILGMSFGVFGWRKESLDQIALIEELTVDGVIKARNTALNRLRKMYINSRMEEWDVVHRCVTNITEHL